MNVIKMLSSSCCQVLRLLVVLTLWCHHLANSSICRSIQPYKNSSGSYMIGMVVPVHYRNNGDFKYNKPGLTWVNAMLFAIDEINNDANLLPGITLGYAIYDSCNEMSIALQSALDFLPEPGTLPGHTDQRGAKSKITSCDCNKTKENVIGVVGDASSASSSRLQTVLAAGGSQTVQISYSSTSTELSDKKTFPTFMRTIPPDSFQALFIADILLHFGWKYVSVLASDDEYGRVGVTNLLPTLKHYNICVALERTFEGNSNLGQIRSIIRLLLNEKEAKVIILWCERPAAIAFFKEASKLGLYGLTWIATESWGNTEEVYKIDQRVVSGMFGVIPFFVEYPPFESYLKSISPNGTQYNPWLHEYWVNTFGCKVIQDRGLFKNYRCAPDVVPNVNSLPRNKYANVIDAVYAIAHGLDDLLKQRKRLGKTSSNVQANELLPWVRKVSFLGKKNLTVVFDKNGDPQIASYSLMNLQLDHKNKMIFKNVGSWNSGNRVVKIREGAQFLFSNWSATPPKSTCSEQCGPGYTALVAPSKQCCWKCIKCPENYFKVKGGQAPCERCSNGQVSNVARNSCMTPTMVFFNAVSLPGIVMLGVTILVIILVLVVMTTVVWFWNTPIIKASNRELSILQLTAMLFIFLMPALYLTKPTSFTCSIRPFYFVCFYAASISVTFTKTDRLLRVFRASRSGRLTKKSRVLNNRVQFATVGLLTLIGGCLCTAFFVVLRPNCQEKISVVNNSVFRYYFCGGDADLLLMVLLLYIAAISLACAIFAFKSRKLPENYNEARYTSFAMFSFLMSWACCVPLYFSTTETDKRDLVFCALSFVATLCMLVILYIPKLYTVIVKPEENTQEKFRAKMKNASNSGGNHHQIESSRSSHRGTVTPPGSSTPNKFSEPFTDARTFNLKMNESATDTDSGVYLGGFRNSRDFRS